MEENDLRTTLSRVSIILKELKLKYHLTGGLASSFYGEPRFTQDIDIVIQINPQSKSLDQLISTFSKNFVIDEKDVRRGVELKKMFQALDEETILKIDFHVGESIPGELDRSIQQEIFPGIMIPIVSKEDAILSKLLWAKKGSEKARKDIFAMLLRNEKIDQKYLEKMATQLQVEDLLAEIKKMDFSV